VGGSESRRTTGFPVELTSFVGRREESAEVRRLLSAGRLLTLTGPGGVGKTRLAGQVAGQVARAFPDGVWQVALAAQQDETFVPHAVIDALGVRTESVRRPLDVLVEHLRERRLLIVLDNCEHLLRSCAVLAATVLAGTEGIRILATSRHRLGLLGERLFEVPPLSAPAPDELVPGADAAERFPALRLFADRAAAVVPGFTLGDSNQQAVARLCRRLDGLPLAIELAAVRVRALGVDQLVERLDDRYQLLTGGSPVSAPRHRTLRSAVDWSYELCTPQEQLVWSWLSVFVGGFDLAAAEAVCGGEGPDSLDSLDVLDAVAGLVDKSVLLREEDGGQVRYRLLVSLRDYGREKLAESGGATAARRRHRDHFARLAGAYERGWFGPDQAEITHRLRTDRDNHRAALDFCLTTPGEAQHGLRLASSLWFHWVADGMWGEGRHWMDGALRAGARPDVGLTRALWGGALMSLVHTRSAAVLAGGGTSRTAAPDEESPVPTPPPVPVEGRASATLACFTVLTRVELACTLVSRGRAEEAVPLCTEAVALCEAHGEQWTRAWALRTLALAHWSMGEYGSAASYARASLRLPYTGMQQQSLARSLDLLAAAEAMAGRDACTRAAVLRGAVDRIWRDIGGNPGELGGPGRPRTSERQARSALGDPAYDQAHRRGAGLTREEAVAYALGTADPDRARTPPASPASPASAGETLLTRRELQVAALVAEGRTNQQIADTLVIARRTAEGHVERILVKLGFNNRSQVAAWFSARGR